MDPVAEIKARLPIEELVGQYCQLTKKGRGFVCICPFHKDTHPSMQVSPDKGIAYCFACSSGGDIFSFYQSIEGVDFRQSIKDLAEKTGVTLPKESAPQQSKDEKEQLRSCLAAVQKFYTEELKKSTTAQEYLKGRGITGEIAKEFGLGVAPDSFSATYDHLLKSGFSKSEIVSCGMAVQKDLQDGKVYDRFRNRLMFPIHDHQGRLVGFGGRTLGEDDAKYINTSEGPLYHKSDILYGFSVAKEAMRESKSVIMVEGYFDVIACHRVGVQNVVAVSGTALTDQHVRLLKRSCETVILCLDQDRAGQQAAERAFQLCSAAGLAVRCVTLQHKDPDEAAQADPDLLRQLLTDGGVDYLEHVIDELAAGDVGSVEGKRSALQRITPLLQSVSTATERDHYLQRSAALLSTTVTALSEDMQSSESVPKPIPAQPELKQTTSSSPFSTIEITLGLFLLYPQYRSHLTRLIEPSEGFALALYKAIQGAPDSEVLTTEMLDLPEEDQEKTAILLMYLDHHNLGSWSEKLAEMEIRKNCKLANQHLLSSKLASITSQMREARTSGSEGDAQQLATQYQQVLKLAQMTK